MKRKEELSIHKAFKLIEIQYVRVAYYVNLDSLVII